MKGKIIGGFTLIAAIVLAGFIFFKFYANIVRTQMRYIFRKLVCSALGVFSDKPCKGQKSNFLYDINIKYPIVRACGNAGIEAAAVKTTVACTDKGNFSFIVIISAAYLHFTGYAFENMYEHRNYISTCSPDNTGYDPVP